MRRLVLALVLVLVTGAEARTRKHREVRADDRPATRAEVAVALQPVIAAHTDASGRQYSAQDVARLEDTAVRITDETVANQERVARLTLELEQLRRDVQELRRMRRHHW